VARQVTGDILPLLRSQAAAASSSTSSSTLPFPQPPAAIADWFNLPSSPPLLNVPPLPDLSKVGNRIVAALQNQVSSQLQQFQNDMANPTEIPARIRSQTQDFVQEVRNVWSETPVGLQEPTYTVVTTDENDYEIRDYAGYHVVATNMANTDNAEPFHLDNVSQSGTAFNSLASYIFGANSERRVMSMTTPVQTTMTGEMRFYLVSNVSGTTEAPPTSLFPDPLPNDESTSGYELNSLSVQYIPPARLAVRRFTGFVTDGEVSRQKEALLTALEMDGILLDVPHGQPVGHVIFQYNPPYTVPMLRRNEIAVPVVFPASEDSTGLWVVGEGSSEEGGASSSSEAFQAPVSTSESDLESEAEGVNP
jgi:SOUL heme-binding protein